jgi:hypothetical protein
LFDRLNPQRAVAPTEEREEEEEEELLIKNIMRVFDKERIRRIFEPKGEEVPCERKLYNKEFPLFVLFTRLLVHRRLIHMSRRYLKQGCHHITGLIT